MLALIPRPVHRALYRAAHLARRCWLGWRGGVVHGCSVVATDGEGRLLLVRHSYGLAHWCFPGGGVGRGEDPAQAAAREFAEELGCMVGQLTRLGVIEEPFHGATNRVHVFAGTVLGEPVADGREITQVGFFSRDTLPDGLSRTVASRLDLFYRATG